MPKLVVAGFIEAGKMKWLTTDPRMGQKLVSRKQFLNRQSPLKVGNMYTNRKRIIKITDLRPAQGGELMAHYEYITHAGRRGGYGAVEDLIANGYQ